MAPCVVCARAVSGRMYALVRCQKGTRFILLYYFVIMWSTGESVPAVGPVTINHFVPLQRRAVPRVCDETVVVHSDNDDDRQSHCAEENDIADLRCEQVVNTPNVAQMQDSRDDADEDDASDLDDGPPSKRVRSDRFLTVDEVLQSLSSHETVLPAVPRGYKHDARFLVNNEDNVQKSSRKKSFLG